jgi:hypothetical protein
VAKNQLCEAQAFCKVVLKGVVALEKPIELKGLSNMADMEHGFIQYGRI